MTLRPPCQRQASRRRCTMAAVGGFIHGGSTPGPEVGYGYHLNLGSRHPRGCRRQRRPSGAVGTVRLAGRLPGRVVANLLTRHAPPRRRVQVQRSHRRRRRARLSAEVEMAQSAKPRRGGRLHRALVLFHRCVLVRSELAPSHAQLQSSPAARAVVDGCAWQQRQQRQQQRRRRRRAAVAAQ